MRCLRPGYIDLQMTNTGWPDDPPGPLRPRRERAKDYRAGDFDALYASKPPWDTEQRGGTMAAREAKDTRRLCGYQPHYFPRLHYFARALDSDAFGLCDYLQFVRSHAFPMPNGTSKTERSHQAHAPIKLASGTFYLSIPTHAAFAPINETEIDYSHRWVRKHLGSIENGYSKSPNFSTLFPEIEAVLAPRYKSLGHLTVQTVLWGLARLVSDDPVDFDKLSIMAMNDLLEQEHPFRLKKVFLASDSPVPPSKEKGGANDWIIELCRWEGATEYHCGGTGWQAYMDADKFTLAGVKPVVQSWRCPQYRQRYRSIGFLPNLSIIDLVMNEDLKVRQRVIQGAGSP
jgi:hypothetical protein